MEFLKLFLKPAVIVRLSVIAAVIIGILMLFGVTWWIAILSVLGFVAALLFGAVWVFKRQRREFIARLKSFNIDAESGKVNPADLRRMYNSGGQAQKDAVMIYCMANNNCPESEAHKAFKEMSAFNPKARQEQLKMMQQMQAQQRKGKGKGRGGFR